MFVLSIGVFLLLYRNASLPLLSLSSTLCHCSLSPLLSAAALSLLYSIGVFLLLYCNFYHFYAELV
jgi:hypothetical protein